MFDNMNERVIMSHVGIALVRSAAIFFDRSRVAFDTYVRGVQSFTDS